MLALSLSLLCASALAEDPLPLDDAVRLSLAQASDWSNAVGDVRIATDEARNAVAAQLPGLGAQASAIYNSPGAGGAQSFVSENGVGWLRATVGLSGTVLGGGAARAKVAQATLLAARSGADAAQRDLVLAVTTAYHAEALAQARVEAAERTWTAATELTRVTGLRFDAGEVPEVDLLRTRMLEATRHDELLQARADLAEARGELALYTGHPAPVLPLGDPDVADVDGLVAAAAPVGPDVDAAAARVVAAHAGVREARAGYLPSVAYDVGFGVDTDTLGPGLSDHVGVSVAATATVPIFDWGVGARSVDAARASAEQADAARDRVIRERDAARSSAEGAARAAAERASVLTASLADAERTVAVSQARYEAGEADLVELTEAAQTLVELRAARDLARYDFEAALARLRRWTEP